MRSINVNDPSLISLVNKLQDVFSTVGVSARASPNTYMPVVVLGVSRASSALGPQPYRFAPDCRRRIAVQWKEFGAGEYCRTGFVCGPFRGACATVTTRWRSMHTGVTVILSRCASWLGNRHSETPDSATHQQDPPPISEMDG